MSYIMNTLTIRIPNSLRNELNDICEIKNRPISDVVRASIRKYIAVAKFRSLRKKTLPFAEAQGLLTDKDIFEALS